ncbi:MAG: hybrid sensor histidine kinase/response regulator [Bacteroidetes bacterium RIFCSPHIGHO2_02_FULL_44_7]|nr:MAG: hybrid sensor histidine kinase/response regulator [Bacteroidetes bacterium RIFCSPHIGHO2_02_FULL_44_7]
MYSQTNDKHYARRLIEASLDPLVTINADGKITDVNAATIRVTGESRKGLIGTNFSKYFTDHDKAELGYQKAFRKGFVSDYSLTIKHKNGKLTDVLYNASVYKDDKGNVLGVFAAARDVTDQQWAIDLRIANKELQFQNEEKEKRANELIIANKELLFQTQEKEKRAAELIIANKELVFQNKEKEKRANELIHANKELLFQTEQKEKQEHENKELEAFSYSLGLLSQYSRSLIEASRDPLITINAEGKIMDMNAATIRLTGISRKKLSGSDFFDYFTDSKKARAVYQKVFAQGSVADSPLTLRHKDGKLTDVLFNGSVYKDNLENIIGIVIVARDVTDQKRIELELIDAKVLAELTTVIAEEAKRKAENATRTAEEAMKAKQQFLSNMSHEIRTPMNAIIGFTKVVLKTELTAKQREYLKAIKVSGDAMIVLINDILDLAKVDSGKLTFEETPFKMETSIAAMLHLFELKIQEKNLKFVQVYDTKIPEVLVGDPMRLHQIVLNLMSNAVKFTNKGAIKVSVELASESAESVTIKYTIEDTGIGIAENKIENIFENFQQASSGTSRIYGGTGLGLAIVKQLVESQNGEITVKSEIGKGSTFSFTLSFLKSDETALPIEEMIEWDEEIKNIRVLVVEDIPLNQLLMKTLLDEFGFHCEIASNGRIAIEKLKSMEFDVVLMDLQMPEMNGFEATEYIRKELKLSIPIMALTADVTTADLEKCTKVGMNDYLAKPVDDKLLYSKIVSLLKHSDNVAMVKKNTSNQTVVLRITDMSYLTQKTKANPTLMMEMITLYLEQTPLLVSEMSTSFQNRDWDMLQSVSHKMIPTFSIFGMKPEIEGIARMIQEFSSARADNIALSDLIEQLEGICLQACEELEEEFNRLKNS